MTQHLWIIWCPAIGFWIELQAFGVYGHDYYDYSINKHSQTQYVTVGDQLMSLCWIIHTRRSLGCLHREALRPYPSNCPPLDFHPCRAQTRSSLYCDMEYQELDRLQIEAHICISKGRCIHRLVCSNDTGKKQDYTQIQTEHWCAGWKWRCSEENKTDKW